MLRAIFRRASENTAAAKNRSRSFRMLALGAAALVGFSGVAHMTAAPASAASSASTSRITIDAPNPVASITLLPAFQQQFNSRTLGGNAFYESGGTPSAYPIVYDLSSSAQLANPTTSTRTFGGTGTPNDPFWIQSAAPFPGSVYSAFSMTQRLTYVVGTEYMRNDITITNNSAASKRMQFGQFADCYFNGVDAGTSNVVPGEMVQCKKGSDAMSLISETPDAAFVGGHYGGVKNAMQKPLLGTANQDTCWISSTTQGSCDTNIDNGFGVAWAADIAPGTSETRSAYLSYAKTLDFVNLTVESSVEPVTVAPGKNTVYSLKVTNHGPADAKTNQVAFALPAGLSYVSAAGDGTYSAATGTWSLPTIGVDETKTINITARGDVIGEHSTQITATSSLGIDRNPCQSDATCGDPLVVTVLETGTAAKSTFEATPLTVTADGESASTITVTAFNANGQRVEIGGADVVLSTTRGTLSEVVDNEDGSYTATLTSEVAGPAVVSMTMNGETGPPPINIQFVAGALDLTGGNTKFEVSGGEAEVGSGSHTITVKLADKLNNPVSGLEGKLTGSPEADLGTGDITEFTEEAENPGTYTATVTSTVSGSKPILVDLDGDAILAGANRDAVFVPAAPSVNNPGTRYAVSTGEASVAGGEHTITVTVTDTFGNPVPGLASKLGGDTESDLGAGSVSEFSATATPGMYTAKVTSSVSGGKLITVTLDGDAITLNGNGTAKFAAGDVSLNNAGTKFSVSDGDVSVEGGSHTVTVALVDAFGNPVPGQSAMLTATTADPLGTGSVTGFAESATPGTYTATITSSASGSKIVTVTFDGGDVTLDGNNTAVFIAGGVSVVNPGTKYSVTTSDELVGTGSHTITVQLKDAAGNAVRGQANGLSASTSDQLGEGDFTVFTESATTPGTYTATVNSTVTGVKVIQVAFGGNAVTLDGNNKANFIAGAVDLADGDSSYSVSTGNVSVEGGSHTVTVKLTDKFGNPAPGLASKLEATNEGSLGDGEVTEFTESETPGTYTATVTSTIAGDKKITVAFLGDAVTLDGNETAHFTAGAVDLTTAGTEYSVSTGDEVVGSGTHTVTVKLVDGFGNPVPGQASKLAAATEDELGEGERSAFEESEETPGTYTAKITSTLSGGKVITVALDGNAVTLQGNGTAAFIAGSVDLAGTDTSYAVSTGDKIVGSGEHVVTVTLTDNFGNAVPGQAVKLKAATEDALGDGTVGDFAESLVIPGTYTASITSTVTGGKDVTVSFSGDEVTLDGNETASFIAAAVDLNNSATSYAVSGGDKVVGSGEHTVTVKLVDGFGNAAPGQAQKLVASAAGLGDGEVSVFEETTTPGTYTATITSTVSGAKSVTVTLAGGNVKLDGNGSASFIAGAVDLSKSATQYAVSTGDEVVGSGEHTVTVKLVDGLGNAVPGLATKLAAATEDALGAGEIADFTESETPGTYTATITSTVSGDKIVTATFDSDAVTLNGNNTASFVAGAVDPANANAKFTVSSGDVSVEGGSHVITVTLADKFGNAVPGQAIKLSPATTDPIGTGSVTGFAESATPGTYTASITSTVSGGKVITVTFDGVSVAAGVNDTAAFVSGGVSVTNAGTKYSVSTGDQVVESGSHTITVQLADKSGNPVPNQANGLSASTSDQLGEGDFTVFTESATTPGTYTATVNSTVTGVKVIQVAFGGNAVTLDSNNKANFIAGAVDLADGDSSYSVSTGNVSVEGGSHTVTVKLTDKFGNPAPGLASKLEATNEGSLGDGEVTEFTESETPGTYTATVTSTIAGDKKITVAFLGDAVTLDGNETAHFTAGAVDLTTAGTEYSVSTGDEVVGSGTHTVTVKLVDGFGNPVPGQASKLAAAAAGLGSGKFTAFAETDEPGTYEATVTSSVSGAKSVTVEFSGTDMTLKGNGSANYTAGAVDLGAAGSKYSVSTGEQLVGSGSHTVTVALTDKFGNAVPGQAAKLKAAAAALGNGEITDFVETQTAGTYSATLGSTVSGSKTVTVSFDGATAVVLNGNGKAAFIAGAVDLKNSDSSYSVSTGNRVAGEGSHTVTVVLEDEFGNPVPGQAAKLAASTADALGEGAISGFVESNTEGTYTAEVSSSTAGAKAILTAYGDEAIELKGNGAANFAAAGVSVQNANTKFSVTTGAQTVNIDPHTVTAVLADKFGNAVPGQAAKLNASSATSLGSGSISAFTETAVAGTYVATIASTQAGSKLIAVSYFGEAMRAGGNATALFAEGTLDSSKIKIVATPKISADGVEFSTVTVSLFDSFGNPITEEQSLSLNSSIGSITNIKYLGNGVYTAELRSKQPGLAHITAEVNGETAEATVDVTLINRVAPAAPKLDPTDGATVTGCAQPGSTVTIRDAKGNVIGSGVAGADCRFTITLSPKQAPGAKLTATATDADGNVSGSFELQTGLVTMELRSQSLHPQEDQVATGHLFQPGEKVTAVLRSTPVTIGTARADKNGDVKFEFVIPADIEIGQHSVTLTGEFSGSVKETFNVTAVPLLLSVTGGGSVLPLVGIALLVLIVGGGLVLIARRRKGEPQAEAAAPEQNEFYKRK